MKDYMASGSFSRGRDTISQRRIRAKMRLGNFDPRKGGKALMGPMRPYGPCNLKNQYA